MNPFVKICLVVIGVIGLQFYLMTSHVEPLRCECINTSNPVDWHLSRVEYVNPYSIGSMFCDAFGSTFELSVMGCDYNQSLLKYHYHTPSQTLIIHKLEPSQTSLLLVYKRRCNYIDIKSECLVTMDSVGKDHHRIWSLTENVALFAHNSLTYGQLACLVIMCILLCFGMYNKIHMFIWPLGEEEEEEEEG